MIRLVSTALLCVLMMLHVQVQNRFSSLIISPAEKIIPKKLRRLLQVLQKAVFSRVALWSAVKLPNIRVLCQMKNMTLQVLPLVSAKRINLFQASILQQVMRLSVLHHQVFIQTVFLLSEKYLILTKKQ